MSPLLWKEFRENAYKIATGLGVVLLVHILRQMDEFNRSFDLNAWALVIGSLCAGVLGMDVIAGERSRGTLDFLLVRPTTVARILAAKFIVGALGLLAIVAAFWVMVYATPFVENPPPWAGAYKLQTLIDVPWVAMVYAWYLPLVVIYTCVFLASSATENSAEAAGAGGIIGLMAMLFIVLVVQFYPGFAYDRSIIKDLIKVAFDDKGELVRIATHGGTVIRRSILAAGLIGAGFIGAWLLTGRFREFTLGRRPLVITGFLLVTLVMTVPRLLPDKTEKILPIGSVRVGERARDFKLIGDRAFVLLDDSLVVIDVSLPTALRSVTTVRADADWSLSRMAQSGSYLCAGGWREAIPADSAGVVCFDITDPDAPHISGVTMLVSDYDHGDPGGGYASGRQFISIEAVGATLLVPNVTENQSELISVRVDDTGRPTVTDVLVLETYEYPEEVWAGTNRYVRAAYVQRHAFVVVPGEDQAYLGLRSGLVIVQVDASGALRELSRDSLGDAEDFASGYARAVVARQDRVFIRRLWPSEYVEFDVSDGAHPRQIRTLHPRTTVTWPRQAGYMYRSRGTIQLHDPAQPHRRPVSALGLARDNPRRGVRSKPILRDGLGYVLIDDELAIFELPPLE
jgi:hypothetical protein